VYFKETFDDEGWRERWKVPTSWKPASELGEWGWTAGQWNGGSASDKGIQTSQDARFYGLSAPLSEPFTQTEDLVLQLSVKHEQKLDCGGAYIKLLGAMDQDSFGGDTPYQIMFGPDICGTSNARTHVIFGYEPKGGEGILINKDVRVEKDQLTHVYTLHVKKDGSFEVFIDQSSVRSGKLVDEFSFLQPQTIKDPTQSKPEDWVDEKRIPDPSDTKPDGWDDIPSHIPDPSAEKPDDWDDEEDGEWEPPLVDNPEYKGAWKPKMVDNPDYIGDWVHPMIANPDYEPDDMLFQRCKDCMHVGFELWQVKSGTIFDSIIVTDSLEEAQAFAEETWGASKDGEKKMFDDHTAEEAKKRAAEAEARRLAREAAEAEEAAPASPQEEEAEEEEDEEELDEL
jgi:calreticulin